MCLSFRSVRGRCARRGYAELFEVSYYYKGAFSIPTDKNGDVRYFRWPSHWTPIPVHTLDVNDDHEGNIFAPCKRAEQLDEQIKNSESYINLVRENQVRIVECDRKLDQISYSA